MRLSDLPTGCEAVEVTPYCIEREGVVDAPTFRFTGIAPQTALTAEGRLLAHVAHDALARPLEISYGAQALSRDHQVALKVHGQSRLLLRCLDEVDVGSGNHGINAALRRVRETGRDLGVPNDELDNFITLLSAVALIAAEALAANIFPGAWRGREADFQSTMRSRLRMNGKIGSVLVEHAQVAAGETDLSFHGIPLELKVDTRPLGTDEAFAAYGQQLAQYIVGSHRATGVLAVLSGVKSGTAPGAIENDIALQVVLPPTGGDRNLAIGVVLIRANLQVPSSLSRR